MTIAMGVSANLQRMHVPKLTEPTGQTTPENEGKA